MNYVGCDLFAQSFALSYGVMSNRKCCKIDYI